MLCSETGRAGCEPPAAAVADKRWRGEESSTSCEQVGCMGWLTKWDREKMEGNLTVRWRCAGFQSELWVEVAVGGIVLLVG